MKATGAVLGLFAIVLLAVCILACRASFSPYGSKIVFPHFDAERRTASVMLLDRQTGRLRRLFVASGSAQPGRGRNEGLVYTVRWTPDGKYVVVVMPQWDHVQVLTLPVAREGTPKLFVLRLIDGEPALAAPSVPMIVRHLAPGV